MRTWWRGGVPAALAGLVALVGQGCGGGAPPDRRPCAVLVTMDATRADALGCYGGPSGVTPSLDRLARASLLFTDAHTVAPLSLPAHASMMTGLWPVRHGVRDEGNVALPQSAETLAELAHAAGYATAAFVATDRLGARNGLDQGFDVYEGPEPPDVHTMLAVTDRAGSEVVDHAIAWLRQQDGRPFLLWVHFAEPLAPYQPPPDFRDGPFAVNPWLGEVAAMDHEIGRLLAALDELGLTARTGVLATAAQGEGCFDHGEPTHGTFCWESTLHVPLLLHLPSGARGGEHSAAVASVVDVLPTLAGELGLTPPAGIDGVDLSLSVPGERGVYFESYAGWSSFRWRPVVGWLDAHAKYVHGRVPQLYLLDQDPREERDVAAEQPALAGRYVDAIARACRLPKLPHEGPPGPDYPHPLAETPRPSPYERLDAWRAWLDASNLYNGGEAQAALDAFERLSAADPVDPSLREMAALCQMRLGQHAEAIPAWRRLVAEQPTNAGAHFDLGVCLSYGDAQARELAVEEIRRSIELDPWEPQFQAELQQLLEQLGRGTEAAAVPEAVRRMRAARGAGAPRPTGG